MGGGGVSVPRDSVDVTVCAHKCMCMCVCMLIFFFFTFLCVCVRTHSNREFFERGVLGAAGAGGGDDRRYLRQPKGAH